MKKHLILFASAVLALAGCSKEAPTVQDEDAMVTFSVETSIATKAAIDNDGAGVNVDECHVAIYMLTDTANDTYTLYDTKDAPVVAGKASFTANLIKAQTYKAVAWCDKAGSYDYNADLTVIKRKADKTYACNEDALDAFFGSTVFTLPVSGTVTVTAKRPFAQLNLIATDVNENFQPKAVTLKYTAPTVFNAVTGIASEPAEITFAADAPYYTAVAPQSTIVMNYLFASVDGDVLDEVAMTATVTADVEVAFANVPAKRNYRTNIIGPLFTDPTDFEVVVDANWEIPDINVDPYAAEDIVAIQAMLDAGAQEIHLLNAPTEDSVIEIAKLYSATRTLVITVPDIDKKLTIKTKAEGSLAYPALKLVGDVADLVINLPESTVTLEGTFGNIEATTAANTLIIPAATTFNSLDVKKGNVVLYGYEPFSKTTLANNCGAYIHLLSAADLKAYAAADPLKARCAGVTAILDVDVDLNNEEWTPMGGYAFAFDGNGHTVSNLKVETEDKNVGFFGIPTAAKISNLTIDGASVKGINHVAVLAGDGLCAQIENCTVKNATVESIVKDNDDGDKAGAITGYLSAEPNASVKNCHVENVTIKAYRDLAAVVGYANGASVVSGNTAKNVKVICNTDINYKNYDTVAKFDANQVVGEKNAAATVENNTCDNVTVEYFSTEGILSLGASKWAITSKEGFLKIAEKLALDVWHSQFVLWTDIDLQGVAWTPLNGGSSADYTTTLDGNGHTISNLTVSGTDNVGFFSNFAGTIKNLTISGANVSGNKRVGILAGQASCFLMENVNIVNSTVSSTGYRVGALVGHCYTEGSFKNCAVDNANISGTKYVGGITGTAGSGEAAATKFEGMTVKNTTISCSDEAQKVDGTYGAFIGSYWVEPIVSGTNVAEGNTIFSANSGFGQHE